MNKSHQFSAPHQNSATQYFVPASGATTVPLQVVSQSELNPARKSKHTAKASDVARYLIHLAAAEEEPEFLTHLRLQKLLYLAQGWSLAMRRHPLFDERVEAWAHGPVVPDVYQLFKMHGEKPIDPSFVPPASIVNEDEKEFVASLWNGYKKYSASSLRQMTHEHEPWIAARVGLKPGEICDKEITKSAMRAFFTKLLKA